MSEIGLNNLQQFREIPSSTTIEQPGGMSGMGLGAGLSWLVSEGPGMLQSLGSTGLEMTKSLVGTVGTNVSGLVSAHPVVTGVVATPIVIGTTAMGVGYVQGWSSGSTVKAPSTEEQQRTAQDRVDTLRMTNSDRSTMQSLRTFLQDEHTITNTDKLGSTLTLGRGQDIGEEIRTNLSSYAMRGAHIIVDGDGGKLFIDMLKDLGALPKDQEYDVQGALDDVGKLPKGMIERNSAWWNKSSHYAPGNEGHFDGIRQFGVDLSGGGHLLFGVREGKDGGHESWFQFEGHGVSSWTDFGGHAMDFARHKGSGNGQVGPIGYCPFSEKNGTEIRLQ